MMLAESNTKRRCVDDRLVSRKPGTTGKITWAIYSPMRVSLLAAKRRSSLACHTKTVQLLVKA
eukprot:594853-Pleurochrysis_carterae.AAC.4